MRTDFGFIQKLLRLYTFNTPIKKGRYRVAVSGMKLVKDLPNKITTGTFDGRKISYNPREQVHQFLYFLGEYEPAPTSVIEKIIRPGDVCLDIGANIGWYTTLLAKLVGKEGMVHSFEPNPGVFKLLSENTELNEQNSITRLNNIALGEKVGEVELHVFPDLPDGHASISDFGRENTVTHRTKMVRLDEYLESNSVDNVAFVKVDIEGSELSMLKGATRLFEQEIPPIIEMEIVLETSRAFQYRPSDIVDFINSQRTYSFFKINENDGSLLKIQNFGKNDIGANTVCVPVGHHQNRLSRLEIR